MTEEEFDELRRSAFAIDSRMLGAPAGRGAIAITVIQRRRRRPEES